MGMVGILPSTSFTLAGAATSYMGVQSGVNEVWLGTETQNRQVMPVAGTFDYLRVRCVDPGGSGQSRAFTLRKNGADTALTATVSTGSTNATDISNTVSVVAGDLVGMKQVVSASAAASSPTSWVLRFTAANSNEFPLLWGASTGAANGTTRYSSVQGDVAVNATEANVRSVMPTGGVISNLYVALDANQATAGQAVTLYLNGSPTALTCTVGSGASTANDTTHTVTVAAGDTISLEWVNSGSNSPRPRAGLKFAPTTDGESIALAPANNTQPAFNTGYQPTPGGTGSGTESAVQTLLVACDLKNLYAIVTGLAGGNVFTTRVRRNTADSTLVCTVTGTATTGNDTTHTVTASDDDLLAVKINNNAGAGGPFRFAYGMVFYITPSGGGGGSVGAVPLGPRRQRISKALLRM